MVPPPILGQGSQQDRTATCLKGGKNKYIHWKQPLPGRHQWAKRFNLSPNNRPFLALTITAYESTSSVPSAHLRLFVVRTYASAPATNFPQVVGKSAESLYLPGFRWSSSRLLSVTIDKSHKTLNHGVMDPQQLKLPSARSNRYVSHFRFTSRNCYWKLLIVVRTRRRQSESVNQGSSTILYNNNQKSRKRGRPGDETRVYRQR